MPLPQMLCSRSLTCNTPLAQVLTKRESLPPVHADGEEADVHVGFWRNPKRFNVAITRARALLVVVGHPVVLMEVDLHLPCT